jgi:lipoprotein-releasing system permease protein
MELPYELRIGWRYTRSSRAGRRNGFISFISGVSMVGIGLGVAALIVVLSVMNGFQSEVRDRMLSVLPHVEVASASGAALPDAQALMDVVATQAGVVAVAPFVQTQALVARGNATSGVLLRGIDPALELGVTPLAQGRAGDLFQALQPGAFDAVIGQGLARQLGVDVGDKITLALPSAQPTPVGVVPRFKAVTVVGLFASGHFQYDNSLVYVHLDDAQRLLRQSGPSGVQLRLKDLHQAQAVARQLQTRLGAGYWVSDWTAQNRNWFAAVQVEKRMMGIILTLIVAVAAFNLVSTLVMTVTEKRADIAILRTLGASPRAIMAVFVVQGATAGVLGTLMGLGLGLLVAFNVGSIVSAIEALLQIQFLPQDIYLISHMPSDPRASDIVPVVVTALVLALLATVYPSWRASRTQPAQALRYE